LKNVFIQKAKGNQINGRSYLIYVVQTTKCTCKIESPYTEYIHYTYLGVRHNGWQVNENNKLWQIKLIQSNCIQIG